MSVATSDIRADTRKGPAPWLHEVPARWKDTRLKYAVSLINQKVEEAEDLPYLGLEHIESWTGRRIVPETPVISDGLANHFLPGDVLFGKLRPYLAKVHHAEDEGVCTTEALVLRPRLVASAYLFYYMLSRDFVSVVDGSTYGSKMPRANWDFIGNLPCLLPPLNEQRAIAAWLDDRTRRIDELVAANRRLIDLLAEQRTALITRAMTKGLNSDAPMKPSGIDWLGKVPKHWAVAPMYARYHVVLGKMLDEKRITGEHLVPYLRNVDVRWDSIRVDDLPEMDIEPHEYHRFILEPGDLLVCEGGEVGRAAIWAGQLGQCAYQKAIHRVRPSRRDRDLPRFLFYVMYAASKSGIFIAHGNPNTIPHLTGEALRVYRFAFPPMDEQRAIVEHLDSAAGKLDLLSERADAAIECLNEYRQALISAAVTGKIDVRGVKERGAA